MDAALRLGLGDALHAVGASLPLEDGVRTSPLDREDDLLEAVPVVRAGRELLDPEAPALGIPGQHPEEVGRPERRLVASHPLPDLDDHVLLVGRVGLDERQLQLLLELRQALLELRQQLTEIGIGARRLEVGVCRAPVPRQPVGALEVL